MINKNDVGFKLNFSTEKCETHLRRLYDYPTQGLLIKKNLRLFRRFTLFLWYWIRVAVFLQIFLFLFVWVILFFGFLQFIVGDVVFFWWFRERLLEKTQISFYSKQEKINQNFLNFYNYWTRLVLCLPSYKSKKKRKIYAHMLYFKYIDTRENLKFQFLVVLSRIIVLQSMKIKMST